MSSRHAICKCQASVDSAIDKMTLIGSWHEPTFAGKLALKVKQKPPVEEIQVIRILAMKQEKKRKKEKRKN